MIAVGWLTGIRRHRQAEARNNLDEIQNKNPPAEEKVAHLSGAQSTPDFGMGRGVRDIRTMPPRRVVGLCEGDRPALKLSACVSRLNEFSWGDRYLEPDRKDNDSV